MSNQNPSNATVRHALLPSKRVPECLVILDNTCNAAAQCPEVLASPITAEALDGLQSALATAHGTLSSKLSLAQALMAVIKAMALDFEAVKGALRTYEASVNVLAAGDASLINRAGLLSRDKSSPPVPLGRVATVHSKPGKRPAEALVTWAVGPGATSYAIEINGNPQTPAGPWTALSSGTGRRRVLKAPVPGSPFLVRIASLGTDGTQSEWSDPILATPL